MSRGGMILAPNIPNQNMQFIDVRDLAKWIVQMVEKQKVGIYNATGPLKPINFQELLQECQKLTPKKADIVWVDEDFLLKENVKDWIELPFWLSKDRKMAGLFNINIQKALTEGLTFRPVL